jgi:hypothetical protein
LAWLEHNTAHATSWDDLGPAASACYLIGGQGEPLLVLRRRQPRLDALARPGLGRFTVGATPSSFGRSDDADWMSTTTSPGSSGFIEATELGRPPPRPDRR